MKQTTTPNRYLRPTLTLLTGLALIAACSWRAMAGLSLAADDKDLVSNGGFEDGTAGWERGSMLGDASSVAITVDADTHHGGKASLHFLKTESKYFPVALMHQEIPFDGRSRFLQVSLWAKADGVGKFVLAVGNDREFAIYIGDKGGGGNLVSHDWKQYRATVAVPPGTKGIPLSLEMYGPGSVWIDDVVATPSDSGTTTGGSDDEALADVKDVPNDDLNLGYDPMMRYFLVGAKTPAPPGGYKLLVVLPGGDGGAGFNPFVRRIWKNALPAGYVVAELVAPKWSESQFNSIVWPTRKRKWEGMRFATEDFIQAVVKAVSRKVNVDAAHVYTLSWSSGGPAAYAASLTVPAIKGSFIAMSVFHPSELPPLSAAKGLPYFLLQSPDDKVTPFADAELSLKQLSMVGAKATLEKYPGGHGWVSDPYGNIRKGIEWLEKNGGQ